MPPISNYIAILPILNKSCNTFRGPCWWISDGIQFRGLQEEEARIISENLPQGFVFRAEENQKAIIVHNLKKGKYKDVQINHKEELDRLSLCIQFVLNLVGRLDPISIPYCVVIRDSKVRSFKDYYNYELYGDSFTLQKNKYRIDMKYKREEIKKLYEIANCAIQKDSNLIITMSRYCAALMNSSYKNRVIDLTICLESLIPGRDELSYRFALYLSLIIENSIIKREENFIKLKNLYTARSSIVHGSSENDKRIKQVNDDWNEFLNFAERCIFYKLMFEYKNLDITWTDHLHALSFGGDLVIYGDDK